HHIRYLFAFPTRRSSDLVLKGLSRGADRKNDEIVDLALFLRLHPLIRIEAAVRAIAAWHLTGDLRRQVRDIERLDASRPAFAVRSEEHTSELQSRVDLVC